MYSSAPLRLAVRWSSVVGLPPVALCTRIKLMINKKGRESKAVTSCLRRLVKGKFLVSVTTFFLFSIHPQNPLGKLKIVEHFKRLKINQQQKNTRHELTGIHQKADG